MEGEEERGGGVGGLGGGRYGCCHANAVVSLALAGRGGVSGGVGGLARERETVEGLGR